ncbi:hypothetical protein [Catellatospora sp. NPDC049609]|uniref:hypothetical protein n=1 Tax=Catellatospora sp. NPDC049609 TaxID=3155505 RepID=UPI00342E7640
MPASSRLADLFGVGSPLRRTAGLLPGLHPSDGWPAIAANGLWGGHLAATPDPAGSRVRVDLYWPGIREATVVRVHPDGSTHQVRGGDPALVCTGWARWDYEAPLDVEVTYQATSPERDGSTAVSDAVTLASGTEAWLKHPTRPSLNLLLTIRSLGPRQRQARRGVLVAPLRPDPIVVHGAFGAPSGLVTVETDGDADLAAIDAILADGSDLLLQLPPEWGSHQWYVSVDRRGADRLEPLLPTLLVEHVSLAFDVTARPDGEAEGGDDHTYQVLADAYGSYNGVRAGETSYLEMSMAPG